MKLLWTGTDVYLQNNYPYKSGLKFKIRTFFERIMVKLFEPFIQEHYVVSEHLIPELSKHAKKPIKVRYDFADSSVPTNECLACSRINWIYPKTPHEGFNVLYYRPKKKNQKFIDWLYGYDIIEKLKSHYSSINFIEVDGSQDMFEIFPIVDFYLRPNRHDGNPRLIVECENNKIPFYWSKGDPDIVEIIAEINRWR